MTLTTENNSDYADVIVFKGSCPSCGVFQSHKESRCQMSGCLVLHYYSDVICDCGQILSKGNLP